MPARRPAGGGVLSHMDNDGALRKAERDMRAAQERAAQTKRLVRASCLATPRHHQATPSPAASTFERCLCCFTVPPARHSPPAPRARVGSLTSTQLLSSVEEGLQLPACADGGSLLEALHRQLHHSPAELQWPAIRSSDRRWRAGCAVPLTHLARLRRSDDSAVTSDESLNLSDLVVDAWATALRRTPAAADGEGGVHMWFSDQAWAFFDRRREPATVHDVQREVLRLRAEGVHLLRQRAWVLPRVKELHWTAVVVDFRSRRVVFADSQQREGAAVVRRACALLEVVHQALEGRPADFAGWRCGSLGAASPRQPDEYNCGVFVLQLARCLHHGVRISREPPWTHEQLDAQRDLIAAELVRGRVLSTVTSAL